MSETTETTVLVDTAVAAGVAAGQAKVAAETAQNSEEIAAVALETAEQAREEIAQVADIAQTVDANIYERVLALKVEIDDIRAALNEVRDHETVKKGEATTTEITSPNEEESETNEPSTETTGPAENKTKSRPFRRL